MDAGRVGGLEWGSLDVCMVLAGEISQKSLLNPLNTATVQWLCSDISPETSAFWKSGSRNSGKSAFYSISYTK